MKARVKPAVLVGLVGSVLAVLLGAGECSTDEHKSAPDPCAGAINCHPGTNAKVIQEPDGYRNVSFSCLGKKGVYVTSYGGTNAGAGAVSDVFVVPDDPDCTG